MITYEDIIKILKEHNITLSPFWSLEDDNVLCTQLKIKDVTLDIIFNGSPFSLAASIVGKQKGFNNDKYLVNELIKKEENGETFCVKDLRFQTAVAWDLHCASQELEKFLDKESSKDNLGENNSIQSNEPEGTEINVKLKPEEAVTVMDACNVYSKKLQEGARNFSFDVGKDPTYDLILALSKETKRIATKIAEQTGVGLVNALNSSKSKEE